MQQQADMQQYLGIIRRRKFHFIIPALIIFVIAAIVTTVLPPIYKSESTILIEAQEIPSELVQTTVTGYIEQRLQTITQMVMSRKNLSEMIEKFHLYPELRKRAPSEEVIQKMKTNVSMQPVQADVFNPNSGRETAATIAFTVSYESKDPKKAVDVANALTSLYLEKNLKKRTEQAQTTVTFLEDQLQELEQKIHTTEENIAEFKDNNMHSLPELMQHNMQTLQRLQNEIDRKKEQINNLQDRKIYLEGQLATQEPNIYTMTSSGQKIMSPKDRLKHLRNEYLSLKAAHSKQHPDVKSMKKQIKALEKQINAGDQIKSIKQDLAQKRAELEKLSQRYSEKHPDIIKLKKEIKTQKSKLEDLQNGKEDMASEEIEKPNNPAYINLQTQIKSTKIEIKNARQAIQDLQEQTQIYKQRIEKSPQVEQRYSMLRRNYKNLQAQYDQTMSRLMEAREAKGLEKKGLAERLTLVNSPATPEEPFKPNRMALMLIGAVLAVGFGVGTGSLAEYMDKSVHNADELSGISYYPILSAVPYLTNSIDRKKKIRNWIIACSSFILICILALYLINNFYQPLDLIWIKILKKLPMYNV